MGESHNGYIRGTSSCNRKPHQRTHEKEAGWPKRAAHHQRYVEKSSCTSPVPDISSLTLHFKGEDIFHVSKKVNETLIFNTFVLCQVLNEFNARKMEKKNVFEGIHKNKLFMGIIGITVVLQVVMVEFLNKFADTERLNWRQWAVCIAISAASWPIGFLVKFIPVPERPWFSYLKLKRLMFI
ncbi:UNVERIFIED_CONTAM: putative calcium-transporting ATPase 13, plasma membrane-type [Sesamum angustifolium]|uniref:Calcium-transporting ATPase 13, plasma membrane-type n=1 Tax=Sesamum angustifolium TaxID=2727405 RepID=A0AAW2MI23_9LAMI